MVVVSEKQRDAMLSLMLSGKPIPQTAQTDMSILTDNAPQRDTTRVTSHLVFSGRETSLKYLQAAYQRVAAGKSSEMVLVDGPEGIGKTRLVEESLRAFVMEAKLKKGYLVHGVYEKDPSLQPYSGLASALTDLVALIYQDPQHRSSFLTRLAKSVGLKEAAYLAPFIPSLRSFLSSSPGKVAETPSPAKFKKLCVPLLKAAWSKEHPIVIVLENMHDSDASTLQLLQDQLLADAALTRVLIVGTLTTTTTPSNGTTVRNKLMSSNYKWKVSEIPLNGLSAKMIGSLLTKSYIGMVPSKAKTVSEILFRKTQGNPLAMMEFLNAAQEAGFVKPSTDKTLTWSWDVVGIENETNVGENVAAQLHASLAAVPLSVKEILQFAALLKYQFTLKLIKDLASTASIPHKVQPLLERALALGYLETMNGGGFKFAHTSLQTKLANRYASKQQTNLHLLVARRLSKEDKKKDNLILAADQWLASITPAMENVDKKELRMVLYHAGMEVMRKGDWNLAKTYFETSSLYSGNVLYIRDYANAMELYSSYAETLFKVGEFPKSAKVASEVMEKARDVSDELRAVAVRIMSMISMGQLKQAYKIALDALELAGETIPKKFQDAQVLRELVGVKKLLFRKTDTILLNLPKMTNKNKIVAMTIYDKLSTIAVFNYAPLNTFLLIGMRMIAMTVQFGLCDLSPSAFAVYAAITSALGNRKEACRFGDLAMRMAKKLNAPCEGRALSSLTAFVYHWDRPYDETIATLDRAHAACLKVGDTETALFPIMMKCWLGSFGCPSLADQEVELIKYCQLPHKYTDILIKPYLMLLRNLRYEYEDPISLDDDDFDEEEWLEFIKKEDNETLTNALGNIKLPLACIFESQSSMEDYLPVAEKVIPNQKASFMRYTSGYFTARANYRLFRLTGLRKYRNVFLKTANEIEKWFGSGVKNCTAIHFALQADKLAMAGEDTDTIVEAYDLSIEKATKCNSMLVKAMSMEYAGDVLLADHRDAEAEEYLQEAVDTWHSWGAKAKARHLTRIMRGKIPDFKGVGGESVDGPLLSGGHDGIRSDVSAAEFSA